MVMLMEKNLKKTRITAKENNDTLVKIEEQLSKQYDKTFVLNSFLLLRDSSALGKRHKIEWIEKNMINKNIYRLDWHTEDEKGSKVSEKDLPYGRSYLDLMAKYFK